MTSFCFIWFCALVSLVSAEYRPVDDRSLRFAFEFDPTLPRLGNLGTSSPLPDGNAGQEPQFGVMSIHYIELVTSPLTLIGEGEIIYQGAKTASGAIDHAQAIIVGEDEVFFGKSLDTITPGTYTWIRTSVAYQEYSVFWNLIGVDNEYLPENITDNTGYIASFVGVETHVEDLELAGFSAAINADKLQGFWGFASEFNNPLLAGFGELSYGDGTPGGTTVPNPLWESSPIPQGSCVVTGAFVGGGLVIPDSPANNNRSLADILVTMRFSTNNSFEWIDLNGNGEWDINIADVSLKEPIVDMGTRGLWPVVSALHREWVNITSTTTAPEEPHDSSAVRVDGCTVLTIMALLSWLYVHAM